MKITPIVAHLQATCPSFAGRISAGIDWAAVALGDQLAHPSAYVIATGDQSTANDLQNVIRQSITDTIDVVVVLDGGDKRGQEASDQLHALRAELWRALVGWNPDHDYDAMQYTGGALVQISGDRVTYRFGFAAQFQLGRNTSDQPAETWHEAYLDGLPGFTGATIEMDCVDPADPNLKSPGPDGRIEAKFTAEVTP
ncbi:hypothetical protein JTE78_14015 [Pseudomonas syringae pv. aptata]|uniref:phage tail terminator protein n=1 Tax=Pseudomonas syringae TaxID=317 RepID=UPI0007EE56AB|nr:hypothetical protein [Pseudomonas syringae]MCK0543868.1 hypothetical protein [Pseudomonas syringae pv. aptata]OBS35435.1 hypothetical protein A9K81_08455 [Pseudomonas syringae pv. syringae]